MTDVRKLLARLNPTTCRFDVGFGGGEPDLTPQDIAAAVAMVKPGLGRELMCHLWWNGGSKISLTRLDEVLRDVQLEEWMRLRQEFEAAQLAQHIAQDNMDRDATNVRRVDLQRAIAAMEGMKAVMWPRLGPGYRQLRLAVLVEMSQPNVCSSCSGEGVMLVLDEQAPCNVCHGRGTVPASQRERALVLKMDESSYREAWKKPYEWLLAVCVDHEAGARAELKRKLGTPGHMGESVVAMR